MIDYKELPGYTRDYIEKVSKVILERVRKQIDARLETLTIDIDLNQNITWTLHIGGFVVVKLIIPSAFHTEYTINQMVIEIVTLLEKLGWPKPLGANVTTGIRDLDRRLNIVVWAITNKLKNTLEVCRIEPQGDAFDVVFCLDTRKIKGSIYTALLCTKDMIEEVDDPLDVESTTMYKRLNAICNDLLKIGKK